MEQLFVKIFKLLETEKQRKLNTAEVEELVDLMILKRRLFPMKISELRALTDRPNPETCLHVKGRGYTSRKYRGISRYFRKDYAVMYHTFPDGHAEIKCMICGKVWDPRNKEALAMVEQSTNRPSSSEVSFKYKIVNDKIVEEDNGPDNLS